MIGRTLSNRYRLEKKIGSGGYGTVYLATDLRMNVPRAVKILSDEGDRTEFIREARIAQGFSHPNVVRVLDVIQPDEEEIPYLVMEFLDGESLGQMVKRGRLLSVEEIRLLVDQIGSALQDAHDKGYVHRDLKPDNVMFVDKHTGDPQFILLDFGIAANFQSTKTLRNAVGDQAGSLFYMSPEQVSGKIDPAFADRIDVYSFGVILYQLICGRVPFPTTSETGEVLTQHAILTRILESPPPPLGGTSIVPLQPLVPELQRSLFQALEKRPSQRPPSIFDLCDEIRLILVKADTGPQPSLRTRTRSKEGLPRVNSAPANPAPVSSEQSTDPFSPTIVPPPASRGEPSDSTYLVDGSSAKTPPPKAMSPNAEKSFPRWDGSIQATMRPGSEQFSPAPMPLMDVSASKSFSLEETASPPRPLAPVKIKKRSSFSWFVAVVAGLLFGALVVCGGAYFVVQTRNSEIKSLLTKRQYRLSWHKAKTLEDQLIRFRADGLAASLGLLSPQVGEIKSAWEQELERLAGLFRNCRFDSKDQDQERVAQYLKAHQEWNAYKKINPSPDKQANSDDPFVQAAEEKVNGEIAGCRTRISGQVIEEGKGTITSYFRQGNDSRLESAVKVVSFFLTPGLPLQETGLSIAKELEHADKKQLEMVASGVRSGVDAAAVSTLLVAESIQGLKKDPMAAAFVVKLLSQITKLPLANEDSRKQINYLLAYGQAKSVDHSSASATVQEIHDARKGWRGALSSLKELPASAQLVESNPASEEAAIRKNMADCCFKLAEKKFQQVVPGTNNGMTLTDAEQEVDPKNYLDGMQPDLAKADPAYRYALFKCDAARAFFTIAHLYPNPGKNKPEEGGSSLSLFDDHAPFQFQSVSAEQLNRCGQALEGLNKYRSLYGGDPLFKSVIETGRRPFKDYTTTIEDQIISAADSAKTADQFGISDSMPKIKAFLEYACAIDGQIEGKVLWELDSATEVLTNLKVLKGVMSDGARGKFEKQLADSQEKIGLRWRDRKKLVEKEDAYAAALELQETLPSRDVQKEEARKKLTGVFDVLCRHFHASTNCRDLETADEKPLTAREKFKQAYEQFMTIHFLCYHCSGEFEKSPNNQSEERFHNTGTLKEDIPRALRQLTQLRMQVTSPEDVTEILNYFQSTKPYAEKLVGKDRLSDEKLKDEFQKKLFSGIEIEW